MNDKETKKQDAIKHCADEIRKLSSILNSGNPPETHIIELTNFIKHMIVDLAQSRKIAKDSSVNHKIKGYAIFGCTEFGKFEQSSITFKEHELPLAMRFYRNFNTGNNCELFAQLDTSTIQ